MEKEDRKEILSIKTIENAVKKDCIKHIVMSTYAFIATLIFWNLSLNIVELKWEIKNIVCNLISVILFICVFIGLYLLLRSIKNYRREFTIVEAKYIKLTFKKIGNSLYHCLDFDKQGKFMVDYLSEYYSFSKYYKMDKGQFIRSSSPGDMFYLIILNKKIIFAFNKKFFEIEC